MRNPGSTTFRPQSYNLNLAALRRGLASQFARPSRLLGTLAAALLAITVASRASTDEVTRWNQIATDASTVADTNPLKESCVFSILHVAINDAVNAVESRYEPYLPSTSPVPGASADAAIASAAHDTLIALLPASNASFDAALEETLRTVSDDSRKTAGLKLGRAVAAAILAARENDGENRTVQYTPGTKPGEYRPTPPDFKPAALTHWGSVTPFVLKSSSQFRCAEPPAVNSSRALADIEEVKAIGGSKSVTRTAEQSGESRDGRRLHRGFRNQILLQLLAARHGHSRTRRQRMAQLSSDPAGTGLPLDPYSGRGCCGYGDGPILQHRPNQFLDDERRTLPGHHPQVLELL
jgi:hypothetical protein